MGKMNRKDRYTLYFVLLLIICAIFLITSCKAPDMMREGVSVLQEGLNFRVIIGSPTFQGVSVGSITITLIEQKDSPLVLVERPEITFFRWVSGKVKQLKTVRKYKDGQLIHEEVEQIEPVPVSPKQQKNDNIFFLILGLYLTIGGYTGFKGLFYIVGYIKNRRKKL